MSRFQAILDGIRAYGATDGLQACSAEIAAYHNDSKGVISEPDAEKIVDAAVADAEGASSEAERAQIIARQLNRIEGLKTDAPTESARAELDSYAPRVNVPSLSEQIAAGTPGELPKDLEDTLVGEFLGHPYADRASLKITNVAGDPGSKLRFDYFFMGPKTTSNVFRGPPPVYRGTAHALLHNGNWFVADIPVPDALLEQLESAAKAHFDAEIVPYHAEGVSECRDRVFPRVGKLKSSRWAKAPELRVIMDYAHVYAWVNPATGSFSVHDD